MSIIITGFADPFSLALSQREEDMAWAQRDYIDRKTKAAESGEQVPEMIAPDATDEVLQTSMSWDFSPGWEERRIKFVRNLRAERKRFMPAARRPIPGGGFENIYPYGDVDLKWFQEGLCCVRCLNWKSEDPREHEEDHRRLREQMSNGVQPPADIPLEDLCGFCGTRLDQQQYRTEAA